MTASSEDLFKGARPAEGRGAAPRKITEGARPQSAGGKAIPAPSTPVQAPRGGSGVSK